jgi:perosamine synthetase
MHTFGHPSKIYELLEICTEYKLVMVEDAAESIGSTYGGRHTGTFGLLGTISFNGNKTITTGGGGAILTNDGQLAKHAKHITTTARVPHLWSFVHDEVGFNYRMPNINAAIGCAQLEKIEDIIVKKRELHQRYLKAFESIPEVTVQRESKGSRSNFWLNSIKFGNNSKHVISTLLEQGNSEGLGLRPPWTLINEMTPYANYESMETHTASKIVETTVNIPSGPGLV